MAEQIALSTELLTEMIEALERAGCQFDLCDGPTLEPIDMKTCYLCETLAKARVAAGLAPRRAEELTAAEAWEVWNASYMASATNSRHREVPE